MKKIIAFFSIITFFLLILFITECAPAGNSSNSSGKKDKSDSSHKNKIFGIIDHSCININSIPVSAINNAKNSLHIAYGHTSHGSQIITGMEGLDAFKGSTGLYIFNEDGSGGALDLKRDMGNYSSVYGAYDLNQPDYNLWDNATRTYLTSHTNINVIIWSWCAGVSHATPEIIDEYLNRMNQLENDYPGIVFVYMTGHLDGTGLTGDLHLRNERIRNYCRTNNKWLYDFADIETYNPDGVYFGNLHPDDGCNYDGGGNWAIEWQNANPGEWYNCSPDHTQPLNGNLKAYAAWWLWARIAGWNP